MIKQLQEEVKKLLKEKKVDLVIGYGRATDGISARPLFLKKEEEVEGLVWDERCVHNLSLYLTEGRAGKTAIVAKGCDVKSVIGLIQENQVKREEIIIIGVECAGVLDKKFIADGIEGNRPEIAAKCRVCRVHTPALYDILIKDEALSKKVVEETNPYLSVEELSSKSINERFNYWQHFLSRCIKCYACRQVCPLCYCPTCVADQTMPKWLARITSEDGNFAWNLTRAFHLAGRCIDCGECERVCPQGIPLRMVNKKIEKDIKEMFGYEAGVDAEAKPPLSDFNRDDVEDFIR